MDRVAASNTFKGIEGLWTMLHELEVVSEADDRVELIVTDQLVDTYYAITFDDERAPVSKQTVPEQRRVILVADGEDGWLISEDIPMGQAGN